MSIPSSKTINIPDFQTGSELIERVPLSNPIEAIRELDQILESLLGAAPGHSDFFRLLELVWPPVTFRQFGYCKTLLAQASHGEGDRVLACSSPCRLNRGLCQNRIHEGMDTRHHQIHCDVAGSNRFCD
jgi:hypothetical protein